MSRKLAVIICVFSAVFSSCLAGGRDEQADTALGLAGQADAVIAQSALKASRESNIEKWASNLQRDITDPGAQG